MCSHFENYFPPQPKTDTTAQLYCTLSAYVTPKIIPRQNQKTNTTPQLYCTLSTSVCKTKNYFLPETKNWHNSTTGKNVPPAHAQQVYLSLHQSFRPSVRAKRGIWSKRVLIRKIGNFSISVHWRNTTIIHLFLLAQKDLDIFAKQSWL